MDALQASVEKMRAGGVAEAAVQTFADLHERLRAGETGVLAEADIEPATDVPDADALPDTGCDALDQAVVIKLNGGLGTSMGMTRAKALLEVRDGLSFLDVTARQVLDLRRRSGARLPLVLMNSFRTRDDSLAALQRYPDLAGDVPADFLQNRVPKLHARSLQPVDWPADPDLEWAPPGHGDLYPALRASGMLETLVAAGYRYAFVSNADNLGAVLDPRILAWFAGEGAPFAMEVADRTPADRKGGHLAAAAADGSLVLREVAQTPDEDLGAFQDISRHRFFNTNNLWVDLRALAEVIRRDGVLGLPMIVNRKTVDPRDGASPPVFQLETAMGAAISVFDGALALRVPRARFAPVKTTDDLLALRSDAYELTADGRVVLMAQRDGTPPLVELDPAHFKRLEDFEERFTHGPPSLLGATSLRVTGDVGFGRDVTVRGSVIVGHDGDGRLRIDDGTLLEG